MIVRALATQSIATLAALAVLAGCSKTPEPTAEEAPKPTSKTTPASTGAPASGQAGDKAEEKKERPQPQRRKVSAKPVAEVKPSEDDPVKGKWTLDDATKGLPPGKTLTASIETDLGTLSCKLFDDKAPITVANFVGLARGIRPWKTPDGAWEKKPAYDGTIFHRIIKGFMIQGGDAKKNGTGEAGYVIPDEVWEDGSHDRPGLLCMANRGKNTNSAQFFITDAAAFHLDNGYTIFGECGPEELVHKLASVETKGERPVSPPVIKKVTITRQ
ncbi:peptidylprolyl isomerase [Sorangium cellulosum]|uniref:Peptidyl-prolyl cis-trans isomerase n=1 Tax=Sorangium cellulosum TaxID=56 RepID=A0A150Q2I1_SORCE|nr:peptidylprolyl isomerase [Sorangium cellulosum]KYF62120.1 peptidylprolyl isomerase [Sorangium cellulosum]